MSETASIPTRPIVIASYGEMAARAKFTDQLDAEVHKPDLILAEYDFADLVPCGLISCHQWHKHGVLIMTQSGLETNIGHICGANHFPESFTNVRKEFRRQQASRAHLDVIEEYRSKASEYQTTISELWDGDQTGEWADRCWRTYRDTCPETIKNQLVSMARGGDWTVKRDITVDQENALGLGFRRDQLTETEVLGHLRGGTALMKRVASILKPIRDRMWKDRDIDPRALNARKRAEWAAWAGSIPRCLDEARTIITAAREFYTTPNLELLVVLAIDRRERRFVRDLIGAIESVTESYKSRLRRAS